MICRRFTCSNTSLVTFKPTCLKRNSPSCLLTRTSSSSPVSFLSEQNHYLPIAQLRNLRGISFSALCFTCQHPKCHQTLLVFCMNVHLWGPSRTEIQPPHPWLNDHSNFLSHFLLPDPPRQILPFVLLLQQPSSYSTNVIEFFLHEKNLLMTSLRWQKPS